MNRFLRCILMASALVTSSAATATAVPLTPFPDGGSYEGSTVRFRPAFFDVFIVDPVLSWLPAVQSGAPGGSFFDVFVTLDFEMCAMGSCEAGTATGQATSFMSGTQSPDGSFQTEMLQMELVGNSLTLGPYRLRESPTRQSLGAVRDVLPPGVPVIDSFFDVFTELSLDGGQTWLPSMGDGDDPSESSDRFSTPAPQIADVPEPSTLALLGAGALLFASRIRKRR